MHFNFCSRPRFSEHQKRNASIPSFKVVFNGVKLKGGGGGGMKGRVTLPMLEPRACDDLRFSDIYYPYNMLSYFVCIFEKSEHNSLACLKIAGGCPCSAVVQSRAAYLVVR